jgi:hypothetical protein
LEDHAFLCWGFLELFAATATPDHLHRCLTLVQQAQERFWDEHQGGYFQAENQSDLMVRLKSSEDGAIPSGNGVMALVLGRLFRLTRDPSFEERQDRLWSSFSGALRRNPTSHVFFLMSMIERQRPPLELVLLSATHRPAHDQTLLYQCLRLLPPGTPVVWLHQGNESLRQHLPFLKESARPKEGALYLLCQEGVCLQPFQDAALLLKHLQQKQR